MSAFRFHIGPASAPADLDAAAQLIGAYGTSLGIDLSFQDFARELANLPGKYAAPGGALLLARDADGAPSGCVALRPIAPEGCCEMKRLYIAPRARGLGLGRALVAAIIDAAGRIGYREMRLDTLPAMVAAIALYRAMGFTPIDPYYDTPLTGTLFLGRALGA
jgi:GNAT superfamily N-acetyltransferase